MPTSELDQLVEMTRLLGQPQLNYVIIGEGNTSYRVDAETFWIKASGQGMNGISAEGFVQVKFAPILDLLEQQMTDCGAASGDAVRESRCGIRRCARRSK